MLLLYFVLWLSTKIHLGLATSVTEHRKHWVLHTIYIMRNNKTHHVIVFSLHMFFFAC